MVRDKRSKDSRVELALWQFDITNHTNDDDDGQNAVSENIYLIISNDEVLVTLTYWKI